MSHRPTRGTFAGSKLNTVQFIDSSMPKWEVNKSNQDFEVVTHLSVFDTAKMASEKKVILVIGATGAQGMHAIDALLAPSTDGTPSPYTIRSLTRDVKGTRAQALAERGVELIEGNAI